MYKMNSLKKYLVVALSLLPLITLNARGEIEHRPVQTAPVNRDSLDARQRENINRDLENRNEALENAGAGNQTPVIIVPDDSNTIYQQNQNTGPNK